MYDHGAHAYVHKQLNNIYNCRFDGLLESEKLATLYSQRGLSPPANPNLLDADGQQLPSKTNH